MIGKSASIAVSHLLAGLLLLSLTVAGVSRAALPGSSGKMKRHSVPALSAFQTRITTGNRIEFNMSNSGYLAVDPNRGAVTPGGFWPSGSEDAYIFVHQTKRI